jgi:flagellar biosynthesis/type III secretory pathway M-ring protein FliF/YscJ
MRTSHVRLSRPMVIVVLFFAASLLLNSCVTTKDVEVERRVLDMLEVVAGLEQAREITIEENLTYALGRLFGYDNVIALVSSHARYGEMEERQEMEPTDDEPGWVFSRSGGPGEIERVAVAVVINEDVLTPEQRADKDKLRDALHQIVENGAGLEQELGDRVSIVFMPFVE